MGSTPGTDAAAHPHGSLENPEVAHEAGDINVRAVIWFVAIRLASRPSHQHVDVGLVRRAQIGSTRRTIPS